MVRKGLVFTKSELAGYLKRIRENTPVKKPQECPKNQCKVKGDTRQPNGLESSYAGYLRLLIAGKKIKTFSFEPDKLKLEWRTTYTPDFKVENLDGSIEYHEVKGFWRDDARVKLKVAAYQSPQFKFKSVEKKKGQWIIKEIPNG